MNAKFEIWICSSGLTDKHTRSELINIKREKEYSVSTHEHTRSVVNTLVRFRVNFVSLDLLFSNSCPRYSNYTEEEFCKEHAARLNFQLDKDKVRGNTLVGYAPKL